MGDVKEEWVRATSMEQLWAGRVFEFRYQGDTQRYTCEPGGRFNCRSATGILSSVTAAHIADEHVFIRPVDDKHALPALPWTGTGPEWKALVERVGAEMFVGAVIGVEDRRWTVSCVRNDGLYYRPFSDRGDMMLMGWWQTNNVTLYSIARPEEKKADVLRCAVCKTDLSDKSCTIRPSGVYCDAHKAEKPAAKTAEVLRTVGCPACDAEARGPTNPLHLHSIAVNCPRRIAQDIERQAHWASRNEIPTRLKDGSRAPLGVFGLTNPGRLPPPRIHACESELADLLADDAGGYWRWR